MEIDIKLYISIVKFDLTEKIEDWWQAAINMLMHIYVFFKPTDKDYQDVRRLNLDS